MARPESFLKNSLDKHQYQTWRALRLFFLYRLLLVLSLGFAFFSGTGPSLLGSAFPDLYTLTIVVYLGFVISSGLFLFWGAASLEQQIEYTLFIDILAITLLMHASGGVGSGLGLLMAISVATGSLLMAGRLALLFAALASLAVLTEQVYAHLMNHFVQTTYTQAGMLGVTFFAVALMAHGLSIRLRETERLVEQRSLDLADMARLNDYIIQQMNTGVLVIDQDDSIRLMNETARQLLGCPDAQTGHPLARQVPELSLLVRSWQGDTRVAPPTFHSPGGSQLKPEFAPLGTDGRAGTLIFLEDSGRVTEQAQQMKLASLGRLTASIAHEIRNPLGAISHAGQLLAESPELNTGDRRLTEIIKTNSVRVNDVIETVLNLSRRDRARPAYVLLGAWVNDFLEEFRRTRMASADLFRIEIDSPEVQIQVDQRQLHQVLGNLCDNALKFTAEAGRSPSIVLRGGLSDEHKEPILDVIDNGPGIPAENIRQLFEPFFTTGAKGTGLGLYIAKELCDINKINLEYLPNPEGGSCFRLGFRSWKT